MHIKSSVFIGAQGKYKSPICLLDSRSLYSKFQSCSCDVPLCTSSCCNACMTFPLETLRPRRSDWGSSLPPDNLWCWRRMEKISWTDHVRNEEVLFRVNEQRNILHEIRKRKADWIGHILRRSCLLKQIIEGKIKGEMEVTRRRGRRCDQSN
jgi:hypothetical protein